MAIPMLESHVGSPTPPAEHYSDAPVPQPDESIDELLRQMETIESASALRHPPKLLGIENIREGYIERYGFVTEAGHAYDAIVGIPSNQTSDIPLLGTSAWFTSTRGHNEHAMRHAMRSGEPIIFVGSEGSYRASGLPTAEEELTLAISAGATLSFAREAANQHRYIFDGQKRILIGESRGAMVGMGILAMDELFDQEVVYADLTAPCFPRKPELKDALKLSGHIYKEPSSFFRAMAHLTFKQVAHYPATLDLPAIAQQGNIGKALFSGEAGDLARLITANKLAHVTCFNDDFASMKSDWETIFAGYPNVHVTPLEGSHLTIADPETLAYIEARIRAFHTLYATNGNLVTGNEVFALSHQILAEAAIASS